MLRSREDPTQWREFGHRFREEADLQVDETLQLRPAAIELYQRPAQDITAERVGIEEEPGDERIEAALARSDALTDAITSDLESGSPEESDEAIYNLKAAALADFSVADDLAPLGVPDELEALETVDAGELEQITKEIAIPALAETLGEIDSILGSTTPDLPPIRGAAEAPSDPKTALKTAVDEALRGSTTEAASSAKKGFDLATEIAPDELIAALGNTVEEIFKKVGEKVRRWVRAAVNFLLRGLIKLLSIFGSSSEAVRKKIADWVEALDEAGTESLLKKLYKTDEIKAELTSAIDDSASPDPARLEAAAKALKDLDDRLSKHLSLLDKCVWLLGKLKAWILKIAPPWGIYGFATAATVATAYPVFAGGDYVDWRDDENEGILEVVPGVRSITLGALN